MAECVQVLPKERMPTVTVSEAVEKWTDVVVKETVTLKHDEKLPEQKLLHPVRNRDDDWYLLLDMAYRVESYIPPGTLIFQISLLGFAHHSTVCMTGVKITFYFTFLSCCATTS